MIKTDPANILKYCPKCGSKDFPAVSDRSFKCRRCGFHFFINSSAAVAAIIFNSKGEILFTRRAIQPNFGKLDLPGGFVDPGETAEEALIRELKEELDIVVKEYSYIGSAPNTYVYSGFTVFTIDFAYIVKAASLDNLKPMDDISAYEFIRPEKVDIAELPAKSMQYFIKKMGEKNDWN